MASMRHRTGVGRTSEIGREEDRGSREEDRGQKNRTEVRKT